MTFSAKRLVAQAAVLTVLTAFGSPLRGSDEAAEGHVRTQLISLEKGWNAVFLEVEPIDSDPAKVFEGTEVDRAATLFRRPVTNQFVTDPGVDLFNSQGWGVWYEAGLPEAFLKSLDAINGSRAYLIHAKKPHVWQAKGRVVVPSTKWQADAFNYVGFSVKAQGSPSFAEFFAGSAAHRGQQIYRLVNGRWKQVLQAAGESMRSGEAFWIFCQGPSSFQGPLRVETSSRNGLLLGRGAAEVILRNESPHPLASVVEHVVGGGEPLPLSVVLRVYGDPEAPVQAMAVAKPAAAWKQPLPALEIGASLSIPFECRAEKMGSAQQGSLLKITTDIGSVVWLPVSGFRDDLGG